MGRGEKNEMKKKIVVVAAAILFCIVICTVLYYCGDVSAGAEIPRVFLTELYGTKTGDFRGSI